MVLIESDNDPGVLRCLIDLMHEVLLCDLLHTSEDRTFGFFFYVLDPMLPILFQEFIISKI